MTTGQVHKFQIFRSGSQCYWELKIDVTVIDPSIVPGGWCFGGNATYTQLRVFGTNQGGAVPAHNHYSLKVFDSSPWAWRNWDGQEAPYVDGSGMCGEWNSATSFTVGYRSVC